MKKNKCEVRLQYLADLGTAPLTAYAGMGPDDDDDDVVDDDEEEVETGCAARGVSFRMLQSRHASRPCVSHTPLLGAL